MNASDEPQLMGRHSAEVLEKGERKENERIRTCKEEIQWLNCMENILFIHLQYKFVEKYVDSR